MIVIDIEIRPHNPIKEFFHKLHSRLEDILFAIIQKLPEKLIPHWLMDWLDRYATKRINELKQQTIKQTWRNMYLKNSVTKIHNQQQDTEKAPSDN